MDPHVGSQNNRPNVLGHVPIRGKSILTSG
uniref:Uncharacterized protein n=1 Tax=Rhizophora mucronata TaxID=61149 RepID=A0A2P2PTZ4_RHIMU